MPVERKKLMQQVKHNKRTEEHTEELRRAAEGKEIHSVEGQISGAASDTKEGQEERIITLRPLNMEDFRQAKSEVAASFATEGFNGRVEAGISYGEGGSRRSSSNSSYNETQTVGRMISTVHSLHEDL
uniref:Uncharacterized protein n=1 Tax=Fagus sylvatica TaxID=28930 RepID=A0A2N9IMI9_FAGSY